jgi:hypothetical protein
MIKFEFTLDEKDAENLFQCIRAQINLNNEKIMYALIEANADLVKHYQNDNAYYEQLKLKMTNTRI